MTKIYVIEGTKEVLKKIQEPIPFIKRGYKFFFKFMNNFLNVNYFLNCHNFFLYHAQIQSNNIYFFENFRTGTSKLKKIKTSLAPTMFGTIDNLWLIEAIVSIIMKVLSWSRTVSHLFLRICCIVDDIVHFIWMRRCVNNYPRPVCGIDRYQFKKKTHFYFSQTVEWL